ncbi:MAG TPA: ECF-type sigma factor [Gemmataceae bacterium]|nr:ECF-type sigma factor [Gemmataceae bacterium]
MPRSVTNWIGQIKAGNFAAAQDLWNRYFHRLVGLAREKLRGSPRRAADEEDAVLSAFDSFFRGAEQGKFPRLQDRDDLWSLLVVITARKALDLIQHERRKKRGGGRVLTEAELGNLASASVSIPGLDQFVGREPTPAFSAQVAEEFRRLLENLEDTELRSVALWKMEGHENNDIADKLGCVARTVERKLQAIREKLQTVRGIWIRKSLVDVPPTAATPAVENPAAVTLTVIEGPHKGKKFHLAGHATFLVGRSKHAHFQISREDRYFSRIHFLVEVNPPRCRLVDMNSHNHTFVNGQQVARVDLRDGDRIKAGHTIFQVSIPTPAPAANSDAEIPVMPDGEKPVPVLGVVESRKGRSVHQPVSQTLASRCGACEGPIAAANSKVPPTPLCSACLELIRKHPQPIPGYRMIRELGRGAMGVVYLAVDSQGSLVALKMITATETASRSQVARFLREAAILGKLWHPHIVAFRDMGENKLQVYFAMEYVRGNDAGRLVKTQGPMPVPRAVGLICQLLDALAYAHGRGFVHRDVKPTNMLVATDASANDIVKLADFGLARVYQDSALSGLTMTGDVGGTTAFMPPEQIINFREAKPATDQYSAAATLYQLLTGRYVHDLPREFEKQLLVILEQDPVPIQKRRPDIPKGLAGVIHRALAREPGKRYADVAAMKEALSRFSL